MCDAIRLHFFHFILEHIHENKIYNYWVSFKKKYISKDQYRFNVNNAHECLFCCTWIGT